eukprot:TRINITY_DN4290_c0_g1_i1.p1 TRINITY_DN4290_c0_g1~~TRINITY_DN4290_c0_g1_i1.p1  ORF type:complete len:377 (+),score=57.37 TRINITY_DN4290_c0_g1_i1:64-1194(+)
MSITVFVRTERDVHDVTVAGGDTLQCFYEKAAKASGMDLSRITLTYDGAVLPASLETTVQQTALEDATEVVVQLNKEILVKVNDLETRTNEITAHAKENPNVVLIIDVTEGVTEDGKLDFRPCMVPTGVQHVKLLDPDHIARAFAASGKYMLHENSTLKTADISDLHTVTDCGDSFFASCTGLVSVNLSNIRLASGGVGDGFFYGCTSLESIDLTGLSQATSVGNYFLASCRSLVSLDLCPLHNVTQIADCFLDACSSLQSIDLSPFTELSFVGCNFLSNCNSLQELDLCGLSSLSTFGDCFAGNCRGLNSSSIDLAPLSRVAVRGQDAFYGLTLDDKQMKHLGRATQSFIPGLTVPQPVLPPSDVQKPKRRCCIS